MKSLKHGKNTSEVEINLTQFGMWLCLQNEEYFLPYEEYPFFKTAKIDDIYHVELQHENHLYWPNLDVDLSVEILKNPQYFPLISQ